jgi:exopolysaccharide production protein ExoY
VLKGDMSLVGPRPMMLCQKEMYPGRDYYALRPGITGPWQVSARNESTFADRAKFDTKYNRSMSLKTDVGLILATVKVVLRATGH